MEVVLTLRCYLILLTGGGRDLILDLLHSEQGLFWVSCDLQSQSESCSWFSDLDDVTCLLLSHFDSSFEVRES